MTQLAIGRPRFLTTSEILTLQETSINQFGGGHGLRDAGLLDSALAQPKQAFGGEFVHEFPFGMAAGYAFHLCKNHPFVDGNKRVAFFAAVVFLRMNGWNLEATQDNATETMLKVATGEVDKANLASWLEVNLRERTTFELRDFFAAIDSQHVLSHVTSAVAAFRKDEIHATALEAAESIPMVQQFASQAIALQRQNQEEQARYAKAWTALLVALHRIAEDMGYEW